LVGAVVEEGGRELENKSTKRSRKQVALVVVEVEVVELG
jgi:hypothetical protein